MSLLALALAAAAGPPSGCRTGELAWGGFDAKSGAAAGDVETATTFTAPLRRVIVKADGPAKEGDAPPRSMWVNSGDRSKVCFRRLLAPHADDDPKRNLMGLAHPVFSLDGGFVYLEADGWATSAAVHQVDLRTGSERFVVDGGVVGVLRNGPYRGMLLVSRHKYRSAPRFGAYDPVDLVRPDGRVMLTIPGSTEDEGNPSVGRWLKAHGWRAN